MEVKIGINRGDEKYLPEVAAMFDAKVIDITDPGEEYIFVWCTLDICDLGTLYHIGYCVAIQSTTALRDK